ncbi:MAG: type VI secretion system baseplate subunit TssF, partial [Gemmataceae bacterium]
GAWELQPLLTLPATVQVVREPSPTLRPMLKRTDRQFGEEYHRKMTYWRLVSHLALNHLSLADVTDGRQTLQEYLALYDFGDDQYAQDTRGGIAQQVREGILGITQERDVAFVPGDTVGGYARGIKITVELDEDKFVGVGVLVFANILDQFFALYASINSFTRLVVRSRQREKPIVTFPPRSGDRPLI